MKPAAALWFSLFLLPALAVSAFAGPATPLRVTVRLDKPDTVFDPLEALGAGVDGHHQKDSEAIFRPEIYPQMLSAGMHPLSYRLRSELAIEAWHWNPRGTWSDPARECGYWTSDSEPKEPIQLCHGYRLPRRGDTIDEANNDGYSMLDDGDPETFWKSNPYLDEHFTREPEGSHPQWVAIDFWQPVPINALRIHWAAPHATRFEVEYATSMDAFYYGATLPGVWKRFPNGMVTSGTGGTVLLQLADRPLPVHFLRIRLLESSRTAREPGSTDIRDRLGYAIRELEAGQIDKNGVFHDAMVHQKDKGQTEVYVSSTDPWHRACDLDPGVTQPGFDLVMQSGLTRGLPMMIPVPVLYDTPENAAALVAYLKARSYPVNRIEMGEEPDGQRADPRDYGALYLQAANRIRAIAPEIALGGPSFVCIEGDDPKNLSGYHRGRWIRDFMGYLKEKERLGDFQFLTFEWYPFDFGNRAVPPQVARASRMLKNAVQLVRASGVPEDFPLMITEYGYSAFACRPEVDLGGALLNTEFVCQFLSLKGAAAFLYGYEPGNLANDWGNSWGNNMIFLLGEKGGIRAPTATYHSARLLACEWAHPGGGAHTLYPAAAQTRGAAAPLVAAYPVLRPDGRWAVMLINKDPAKAFRVSLDFLKGTAPVSNPFAAPFEKLTFSSRQYEWKDLGAKGYPVRSEPAAREVVTPKTPGMAVIIPPWSLTVLRSGTGEANK
jgi:hypothetical protein